MLRWFVPSWSGDYRLEVDPAAPKTRSLLTVENPTDGEMERLETFLATARTKKWTDAFASSIARSGATSLVIDAPIVKAGPVLAGAAAPKVGQLTAVRSASGDVSVDVDAATAVAQANEPEAAATVKKPTLCCPYPIKGPDVRASEALKTFCTSQQWKDWLDKGWLIAHGQVSGHAYRIAHRHSAAAQAQGKVVWDLDDDHVIHCFDWTVPPAEEVLGIKLILEHHEPWIRNHSGALGKLTDKFANPLGDDGLDGTDAAQLMGAIGGAFRRLGRNSGFGFDMNDEDDGLAAIAFMQLLNHQQRDQL